MKTIIETDKEFICDIKAPCFQTLSNEEVELVRASKTQILYRKGENLTKQGTFASYILFVIDGVIKQYVEGDGNHNYNLRIIKQGDFVGLSSVFLNNTFNYSTIAITNTKVFLIEKEAISKIIKLNGEFAFNIITRYCEHNTILFDTIRNLMYKQINGRIAEALLNLEKEVYNYSSIFPLLTRKDIADFAGTTTESAVKILKNFEKDGIIKLVDKNIIITNLKLLQEINEKG